ncbi:alpha-1,3-glucan synthase [Madurella fahalii]|uniref:alpha-1,3-glucan synthase n=1 Tax=Madurella fahalii TaxID=1157608 RepID=A0ABQ0GKJ7_9PEZI
MTRLSFHFGPLLITILVATTTLVSGLRFDASEVDYNLNSNRTAKNPLDYWGQRPDGFQYAESPKNWRFPFYTIFLDRFVNGDPQNDDINGTIYETDMMSTQLRFGGDLEGLRDSLDYIAGMGIKGLYIAGSPFINLPWGADSYSPVDLTLLDKHFGTIKLWQEVIDEIHRRGMWVVLDNTMATMSDLIGFEGYLNESTPFHVAEHKVLWKTSRRYLDFDIGNEYNATCDYPQFWNEDGTTLEPEGLVGCYDSDFDQYGDIEAFGVFPDWQRQLAKFASVQDRLRDWEPSVAARIEHFSCMAIAVLDIDGFRIDKAVQVTVDAQASFSSAMRKCAGRFNKTNFVVFGEITSGNTLGSIYLGRGREPRMANALTLADAMTLTTTSADSGSFIREPGNSALDAGAFHYSIYRFMTRFLGLSGNLEAGHDLPLDWAETWNRMVLTNDFHNAYTNEFDPRHLYGATNQDVFRWPAIEQGVERMLLAYFITTLLLPGAPLVYYGEEQALYALDGTASNYVYGRQAFAPSPAWKTHGCFGLTVDQYIGWHITKGRECCHDETVAWDHRDPSAPLRNIFRHMFALHDALPVLEHGWLLETLAKQTTFRLVNGSSQETEFGIWSVARGMFAGVQDEPDTPVWLVYHNRPDRVTYEFDCGNQSTAFISPFDAGSEVRNLLGDDKPIRLESSTRPNGFTGGKSAGCLSKITMEPYEFRAYVQPELWVKPAPMITKFEPGHDRPIDSTNAGGRIDIGLEFNVPMDCGSVTDALSAVVITNSETNGTGVEFDTPVCSRFTPREKIPYTGAIQSAWKLTTSLRNVPDGIVKITVANAWSADRVWTNVTDHFLLRFGKPDNPVVFPTTGNYSRNLLVLEGESMYVKHSAPGATQWRYSTNWGSTWSSWNPYKGEGTKDPITEQAWSGTPLQEWPGKHLMVQYFSKPLGSSAFIQSCDSNDVSFECGFPHIKIHGPYNKWGYDAGLPGSMDLVYHHTWTLHYMHEWPVNFQLNIWGINPDNQPDVGFIFGDIDSDGIVDRLPPSSLAKNVVNITTPPPMPALSYNDATWRFDYVPSGHVGVQILLFTLLAILPVLLAALAGRIYVRSFYRVKINKSGFTTKGWLPLGSGNLSKLDLKSPFSKGVEMNAISSTLPPSNAPAPVGGTSGRRTVLIATMEYNIDDLGIKIKIGGLGVMAQLMGSALSHVNLIWVVPAVGDVEYQMDRMEAAEPMFVNVMGQPYEINVFYYTSKNITYVILDAPIFRKQTKADPYIARMDDIESAILYAAWNSCIAETIRRFPVDIYHINDYHGAAAPLYLLPQTVPCCLSLHNAEFQGMWPLRTPEEQKEVCDVFNLPPDVVKDYIQYGSVFNLLHAAASYLRVHQRGFGAVGVSRKYGGRSLARYPIFWSLKNIGQLPNPDPSDTAEWDPSQGVSKQSKGIEVDQSFEEKRADLRRQAQEWAGLEVDHTAEFILEKYPKTQLICVGPVIDLYGRFAALKLEKLMERYPKRVFSKPEFTQLPPYIFSGAEFALIPSRDEPFGLVAVEFGRKGALGVGARVGGLGQMPGFWYTVESMTPSHLLQQLRQAIISALECKAAKRALMRAWSARQRFPVAQWVKQLDGLYNESIRIHQKEKKKKKLDSLSPRLSPDVTRPSSRSSTGTDVEQSPLSVVSPGPDFNLLSPSPAATPIPRALATPDLPTPSTPWAGRTRSNSPRASFTSSNGGSIYGNSTARESTVSVDSFAIRAQKDGMPSPGLASDLGLGIPRPAFSPNHRNSSLLSLPDVVGDRHDLKLQQVDQFFNDSQGEYSAIFEEMLDGLSAENSAGDLCIEVFLRKSEKEWFSRYRDAKLGRHRESRMVTPANSRPASRNGQGRNESVVSRGRQRHRSMTPSSLARSVFETSPPPGGVVGDEFLLGDAYQAPTGLKKFLSIRIGDWPVYSFLLALGQIISVSSYQIVLLTGETSQTPEKLYMVAATYIATSFLWWGMERNFKSVYALSAPWCFFGLAFLLIGIAPFIPDWRVTNRIEAAATCFYAVGASSGALSFALNFGDEGGAPTKQWITRALVVSGFAQVYSIGLWYWGSIVADTDPTATVFVGTSKVPQAIVHVPGWGIVLLALGFYVGLWAIVLYGFSHFSDEHTWLLPIFAIGLCAPRWAQEFWGTSGIGWYLPWAGGPVGSAILSRCLWLWLGLLDNIQGVGLGMLLLATLTRQHVLTVLIWAQIVGSVFTMLARATSPNALSPHTTFPDFSQGIMPGAASPFFWVCLLFQLIIPLGFLKCFRKEQVAKP